MYITNNTWPITNVSNLYARVDHGATTHYECPYQSPNTYKYVYGQGQENTWFYIWFNTHIEDSQCRLLNEPQFVPEVLESWYEICIGSPTKNLEHEFFITDPKTEH